MEWQERNDEVLHERSNRHHIAKIYIYKSLFPIRLAS